MDALYGFLFATALILGGWCLLSGFYHSVCQLFDLHDKYYKWKRNNGELTVLDNAVLLLIDQIVDNAENWVTVRNSDTYGNDRISVERADRRVKIRNFKNPEWIEIDLEGVGVYKSKDLMPCISERLSKLCIDHRQLLAVQEMLT